MLQFHRSTTESMNCEEGELKENKCEDLKKKPCPWRMTCTDLRQKITGYVCDGSS